jgi:hypothetical protein
MSTSFTWTIDQLYTLDTPQPGFVCAVFWTIWGSDGNYSASVSGNVKLNTQEGPFTQFSDLSKDQVLGWVQHSLGGDKIEGLKSQILDELKNNANVPAAPQVRPLPWGSLSSYSELSRNS